MKNAIAACLLLVPIAAVVGLIESNSVRAETSEVRKIEGSTLRRSEAVWTNRVFVSMESRDEIRGMISKLVEENNLSDKAKQEAKKSCWEMLSAYGSGDWNLFRSARLPTSNYKIGKDALKPLGIDASDKTIASSMNAYSNAWHKTFGKESLFNEISLMSNSVSLLEIPPANIELIRLPEFTAKTNRNWIQLRPARVFEFDHPGTSQNSDQLQVLRFTWFGRFENKAELHMMTFVWDEKNSVWLPWRFYNCYVGKPAHKIDFF